LQKKAWIFFVKTKKIRQIQNVSDKPPEGWQYQNHFRAHWEIVSPLATNKRDSFEIILKIISKNFFRRA
jgi:hypothetical protein